MASIPKVYLAGGMETEWRSRLKEQLKGSFEFFCPVDKEQGVDMDALEYGTWDLHHVRLADIVFAYMKRDNMSGIGLACELGFAFALGKTVILVLEQVPDQDRRRWLEFMTVVSTVSFTELDKGIWFLSTFAPRT